MEFSLMVRQVSGTKLKMSFLNNVYSYSGKVIVLIHRNIKARACTHTQSRAHARSYTHVQASKRTSMFVCFWTYMNRYL